MLLSWPTNEQAQSLHRRLCDGEATAPSDFAVAYTDLLGDRLQAHNPGVDADLCRDAAHRAILALIHRPSSFDPGRGELAGYLRMSAQGDLRNLLRKEGRHHRGRLAWKTVEVALDAGKYLESRDDSAAEAHDEQARRGAAVLTAVRDALAEADRRIFDLMRNGERRTAAFAALLGVSDRSPREQEREVKRAKDRIKKRILRAEGRIVSKSLEALARRVENDPFFLAGLLAHYARSEAMDDARLAAVLRCRPEDLTAIRLCRAPRPDRNGFREDVDHIAARFGLDADRLMEAVRRGEAVRRLRAATLGAPGFLAAARDGASQSEQPPPGDEP